MLRNLFHIKPGRLTQSPAPRHLAVESEMNRRLEYAARNGLWRVPGKHVAEDEQSDAEWMQAIR